LPLYQSWNTFLQDNNVKEPECNVRFVANNAIISKSDFNTDNFPLNNEKKSTIDSNQNSERNNIKRLSMNNRDRFYTSKN